MSTVEAEFLMISEAVTRLTAGMFGGPVKRSKPVAKLKENEPRLSVGFGPHRQKAAAAIHDAMSP